MNRSMRFSNSRIFPGQWYLVRAFNALWVNPGTFLLNAVFPRRPVEVAVNPADGGISRIPLCLSLSRSDFDFPL